MNNNNNRNNRNIPAISKIQRFMELVQIRYESYKELVLPQPALQNNNNNNSKCYQPWPFTIYHGTN
jgi:hypothetical protein